ncbi:MAG TPA: sigma-54 dependent transcriptional regulator [Novimethylophilus sp.]|jgi:DNA-binding NtrC family response regulator|uniref:sigma-54-dependent transcriptional regulator n=1 Tax=Novimethylophilus sp. TaxID=2137426 RepID=UPI002F3F16AD
MVTEKPRLMLVDDDPLITDTLHFVLSEDFDVSVAESRTQARSLLRQLGAPPQIALVDLGLPPAPHSPDEGFKLIGELLAYAPAMKIFVLSGQNNQTNARHALALGAMEFIAKPCDVEQLRSQLKDALRLQNAESVAGNLQSGCGLIGESLAMNVLRNQIRQFATAPFPVLIEGESGSGKELVAACLHSLSARRGNAYLSLNCAAISPTLAESILFGHAKGAFTGAESASSGYFEDAGAGSLLLDEIGELPGDMQAKLLRVLENGEYQRVGETQIRKSRARILAATNRDLRDEVRAGRFRADLYHRLNVFALRVPPLRELEDDRLALLEHFRSFYAKEIGRPPFELDHAARQAWMAYPFPGNVRELRNIVIRLAAKHAGDTVNRDQLAAEFDPLAGEAVAGSDALLNDPQAMMTFAQKHLQSQFNVSLDHILRLWEKSYVEAALKLTHGNLSQASRLLGVNRTTLYGRMQFFETTVE